ncbi:MAG: MarR family winged helix-turn-helix transcriptional regulator [Pseudomonadota bacterium]
MSRPAYHDCLNARLRRSMRAVGRRFDAALKPVGLKSTQFTVLAVFAYHSELTVTKLADLMAMDRTTLTRNLQPLVRQGWLEIAGDKDGRVKVVRQTSAGRAKLAEATPLWQAVQDEVTKVLGAEKRADLMQVLAELEA